MRAVGGGGPSRRAATAHGLSAKPHDLVAERNRSPRAGRTGRRQSQDITAETSTEAREQEGSSISIEIGNLKSDSVWASISSTRGH